MSLWPGRHFSNRRSSFCPWIDSILRIPPGIALNSASTISGCSCSAGMGSTPLCTVLMWRLRSYPKAKPTLRQTWHRNFFLSAAI